MEQNGNGADSRTPPDRGTVMAILRLHGIPGTVAAKIWTLARDVRSRTRRRGIEHAVTLDAIDGEMVGSMLTGCASSTDLTPHLRAFQRGHAYVQVHTHPTSPSFSALDVRVLADHAAIRTMIAVGADGTWYVMSRNDETSTATAMLCTTPFSTS